MNLATRIMGNGAEVIVADRSSNQGENLRIAPTAVRVGTSLPSTISDEMFSRLPPDGPQASLIASLRLKNAKLVTVEQPTTYTYLKTKVSGGITSTQTTKDVIKNTITKLAADPTATSKVEHVHSTVLADYDKAVYETKAVKTTYTHLQTLIDDEVPIVVSSKQTITNTYSKLLDPSEIQPSEQMFDTNTYYNTHTFTKTLDDEKKITSVQKNEVTQVIITEAPSLQVRPVKTQKLKPTGTTDIEKTYFVTYTYYKTFLKNGKTVIETNIATESDVVTEKFYLNQVRTSLPESIKVTAEIGISPTSTQPPVEQFKVYATKTYLTTFTYFTTILQGKNTVTSSNTKVVYNIQTETISTGLDSLYLDSLRSSFAAQASNEPIITTVMLAGEALEITAVQPTSTKPPLLSTLSTPTPSVEHVVTASTLNFIPDEIKKSVLPPPYSSIRYSTIKKHTDTPEYLLSNLKESVTSTRPSQLASTISVATMLEDNDSTNPSSTSTPVKKNKPKRPKVPIKNKDKNKEEEEDNENDDDDDDDEYDDQDLKVAAADLTGAGTQASPEFGVNDFLSMGQTGINAINALKPVFSAMAGLISNNFGKKANATGPEPSQRRPYPQNIQSQGYSGPSQARIPQKQQIPAISREPVYIPVGGQAAHSHLISEKHIPGTSENVRPDLPYEDSDKSESAWIDSLPLHRVPDERIPLMDRPSQSQIVLGKPTMESPILQDGISIQPGQIITANSDVIVGRPSVLGKRPMRPAPPPPPPPHPPSQHSHGQHLSNQHAPNQHSSNQHAPNQHSSNQHAPNQHLSNQHAPNQHSPNRRPPPRPEVIVHHNDVQHSIHHKPQIIPLPQANPKQQIDSDYIGMRPPPLPQSRPVNPVSHKNRYPPPNLLGTPVLPHDKTIVIQHPSDGASHTVRPSHPLLIDGGPTFYPGNNNEPIISEPVPLPEPGFIGVSSIGVSNQDILQQHGLKEKEGHIIRGTIGELPVRPQQLGLDESSLAPRPTGPVILDNPDTMPVLQPGSKVNVPVSFGGGVVPPPIYHHNTHFVEPHYANKKETKNPPFIAPPFENTIWPGQVQNHILDSRPGQHIHHIPIEARPVIVESDVQPGQVHSAPKEPRPQPNLVATRYPSRRPVINNDSILDMQPPPRPQRPYEPTNNQGPSLQVIRGENYPYERPNVYGPIIVPDGQNLPADDVIVSPHGNDDWENDDEPVKSEGEKNGEVIQESINSPSLPSNLPPEIVTEKPVNFDGNRPENSNKNSNNNNNYNKNTNNNNNSNQRVTINRVTNRPVEFPPRQQVYINPAGTVDDVTRIPNKQIIRQHFDNLPTHRSTPRPFITKPLSPSDIPMPLPMPEEALTPPMSPDNFKNKPIPVHSQNPRFPVVDQKIQDPNNIQFKLPAENNRPPPSSSPRPPSSSFRPPPKINDNIYSGSGPSAVVPSPETLPGRRPPSRVVIRPRPTRPNNQRPSRPPPPSTNRPLPQEVLEPPRPPPVMHVVESSITEPETPIIITTTTEGQDYSIYDDNEQDVIITSLSRPVVTYETVASHPPRRTRTRVRTSTKIQPTKVSRATLVPEIVQTKYVTSRPQITTTVTNYPKILGAGFANRPDPLITTIHNRFYTNTNRESTQRYSNIIKPESTIMVQPSLPSDQTTRYITQTETLTITATETTVISSRGQPYTKTIVLTQTESPRTVVSTIVGTITEIHTIDPSTVTTTVSATVSTHQIEVTTTVYQPTLLYDQTSYPTFTIRPAGDPPMRNDDGEETELEIDQENEINRAVENSAPDIPFFDTEPAVCQPKCDVNRNEFCKEYDGALRCVCRPGFARTFFDSPCTPTYTYSMKLLIDKLRGKRLSYKPAYADASSNDYRNLANDAREGLRRAAMRSDLRDIFQGTTVTGFEPTATYTNASDSEDNEGVMVNFYIQLSESIDEKQLDEKFKMSLQKTNFSLGGTEMFAARETRLASSDFDECSSEQFNDCSENAQCFNFRGTYTCSCKEDFTDLSPSTKYPGRECTSEILGCEKCNYHGTCYTVGRGDDRTYCDCFQWYAGDTCNINLKVLLIALVTIGTVMLLVLVMCSVLTCLKKKQPPAAAAHGAGFMRYRGPNGQMRGTMDKAAMIQDTSSESSVDGAPLPYLTPVATGSKSRGGKLEAGAMSDGSYVMEKDRSLTVMIPRAKYRPVQSTSVLSTFAPAAAGSPEQRLINYLDTGSQGKRKQSSSTERSRKSSAPMRKQSAGALVSAGFEVSAQVNRGGGKHAAPADHLTMVSQRSGRTTLRTADNSDIVSEVVTSEKLAAVIADYRRTSAPTPPPMPPVTVSEARSYDETLVQPATRSLHRGHCSTFGSKPGSSRHDGQTMAERDIGSTFMMPQSHLYKPARRDGSEGSNFDSL